MTAILINYADRRYFRAQRLNVATGLETGGFDYAIAYGRKSIDRDFLRRNRQILSDSHGAGFWLWKPYIVVKTLHEMADGDMLFYCDSGAHFITNAAPVLEWCRERAANRVLLFSLEDTHINRAWTKRDCFHYMGLDREPHIDAPQTAGTYLVCEKNAFAIGFFEEWLCWAQDARILTDAENVCGLENYPEFHAHRHDQSILSLLAVKHGIDTLADISQFGNARRPEGVPQIVDLTRWRE